MPSHFSTYRKYYIRKKSFSFILGGKYSVFIMPWHQCTSKLSRKNTARGTWGKPRSYLVEIFFLDHSIRKVFIIEVDKSDSITRRSKFALSIDWVVSAAAFLIVPSFLPRSAICSSRTVPVIFPGHVSRIWICGGEDTNPESKFSIGTRGNPKMRS